MKLLVGTNLKLVILILILMVCTWCNNHIVDKGTTNREITSPQASNREIRGVLDSLNKVTERKGENKLKLKKTDEIIQFKTKNTGTVVLVPTDDSIKQFTSLDSNINFILKGDSLSYTLLNTIFFVKTQDSLLSFADGTLVVNPISYNNLEVKKLTKQKKRNKVVYFLIGVGTSILVYKIIK